MKYFGTDGFRGEANVGLTVEHAYKIGRFVGWYYGANRSAKARVIVGKDTRRSSYMFEAALVSGLVASGADAYMLHVIPSEYGWGFSAEGDWKTSVLVRIGAVMGYGLEGGASLMEDYSYNFVPGNEFDMGSHMLEVSPSIGTIAKPKLAISDRKSTRLNSSH